MPVHSHGDRPYDWVGAMSERRAALTPDRVALRDATTGESYTYADLDRRADHTARLLADMGVERGDRVVTLSRNRPELVDLFFATGKTGSVLAPLSHRLAPPEVGAMLDDVDPALVVVEDPFRDLAAAAMATAGDLDAATVVVESTDGGTGSDDDAPLADRPRWSDELPADPAPVESADLALSDPALFLHTGGSTGTPKETVLTHGGVLWNSFNTITAWGMRPDDVTPMVFPMFHTGGWNVLTVPSLHMGAEVVIAREFDPGQVLEIVDEDDATVLVAVPAVLRMMTEHDRWEEADLSTLRFVKSGGGPCRESVMESWWDRGVDLSQGYGLTECGPNNFAMPEGWPREKADTVGRPAPHVDARVVDEDGDPLSTGEIGELELASPHAADGYWHDDAETAAVFGPADADGDTPEAWVSTGDLARVDADGYYAIEGRKKHLFVSGGENVYPAEVEDAVAGHPAVEEVVVIGVPDAEWGTVGKAVVQGDPDLTLATLREFLDGRLARFKHPRHLAFVDEMPTSGPSKIDREAVAERFGEE